MFAKPATTFVRYDQYKNIIDNDKIEKTKFKEMFNKNFENEDETDNLYFLTSSSTFILDTRLD